MISLDVSFEIRVLAKHLGAEVAHQFFSVLVHQLLMAFHPIGIDNFLANAASHPGFASDDDFLIVRNVFGQGFDLLSVEVLEVNFAMSFKLRLLSARPIANIASPKSNLFVHNKDVPVEATFFAERHWTKFASMLPHIKMNMSDMSCQVYEDFITLNAHLWSFKSVCTSFVRAQIAAVLEYFITNITTKCPNWFFHVMASLVLDKVNFSLERLRAFVAFPRSFASMMLKMVLVV